MSWLSTLFGGGQSAPADLTTDIQETLARAGIDADLAHVNATPYYDHDAAVTVARGEEWRLPALMRELERAGYDVEPAPGWSGRGVLEIRKDWT